MSCWCILVSSFWVYLFKCLKTVFAKRHFYKKKSEKWMCSTFFCAKLHFLCVHVLVWLCVASLYMSIMGLWKKQQRFRLKTDIILRILNVGCPWMWFCPICGWWDEWDVAWCFSTTWNAIYLSTRSSRQEGKIDGVKMAGNGDRD